MEVKIYTFVNHLDQHIQEYSIQLVSYYRNVTRQMIYRKQTKFGSKCRYLRPTKWR